MKRTKMSGKRGRAADVGLLALRVGAGSMMAAHGAQKLFGAFQGPGLDGFAGFLSSMGLKPAKQWAALGGFSEFGGGTLLALGAGGPVGPIMMQGAMITAARRAHWKLPIWVTSGGAEAPLLYGLIGLMVATNGPGRYSLDHALGINVPRGVSVATLLGVAAGLGVAELQVAAAKRAAASDEDNSSDDAPMAQIEEIGATDSAAAADD